MYIGRYVLGVAVACYGMVSYRIVWYQPYHIPYHNVNRCILTSTTIRTVATRVLSACIHADRERNTSPHRTIRGHRPCYSRGYLSTNRELFPSTWYHTMSSLLLHHARINFAGQSCRDVCTFPTTRWNSSHFPR
jgi:hypothetical protein